MGNEEFLNRSEMLNMRKENPPSQNNESKEDFKGNHAPEEISSTEAKEAKLRELLSDKEKGMPDAVFILSGGIKKIEKKGEEQYHSLAYSDKDAFGLMGGGKARVLAASYVGKIFPDLKFVTTSKEKDMPSHATVMAKELQKRGIKKKNILLEEESFSTLTELFQMVKIAVENNWVNLSVITNDFHIPRAEKILEKLEEFSKNDPCFVTSLKEFKERGIKVNFIAAEDILGEISEHYKKLVERVRKSPEYEKRMQMEQKGIDDLEEGKYTVSLVPGVRGEKHN